MSNLEIAELVSKVRAELEDLDSRRIEDKKLPFFKLQTMELEIRFVARETSKASGGVDLKIVSFGGESGVLAEEVQTIRLKYGMADFKTIGTPIGSRGHSAGDASEPDAIEPI